jgi:hypothetical protein
MAKIVQRRPQGQGSRPKQEFKAQGGKASIVQRRPSGGGRAKVDKKGHTRPE